MFSNKINKMLNLIVVFMFINNMYVIAVSGENIELQSAAILSENKVENPYPSYSNVKEESSRQFLLRYKSFNPVMLLVDNVQESHHDAYNFVRSIRRIEPRTERINVMLMKFNTTGVTPVLETTLNNRIRFEQLLNQTSLTNPSNNLGRDYEVRSAVFFGILNAVHRLPPASGIVVFMKRGIEDEYLAQQALIGVIKKKIQVFVVWGGKNEEPILNELANYSRGAFFTNSRNDLSNIYYESFLENVERIGFVSTILVEKNLYGEYNVKFPVDSGVTGIHIKVTPNITNGVIITPRGYVMDILKNEDVVQYSVGSFIKRGSSVHQLHLNITTSTTPDVGIWTLRVQNTHAPYNITIFAHTKLVTNAYIVTQNLTDTGSKSGNRKKFLKLRLIGDISTISNISFVTQEGKTISNNIKFAVNKDWNDYLTEPVENIDTIAKKEVYINSEKIPPKPFYVVVNGKNVEGHDFRRLSYVKENIENDIYRLPPLTIEVGLASELITEPSRRPQVFFEVTNNGANPIFVRFYCKDEKSILLAMNPWFSWINPQETVTVRLTLITRPGVYKDVITFTAVSSETVSKNVIVDVGTNHHDRRDPELHYQFTSDCLNVLFTSCEEGTWTVEVKAKDTGSGLLQVYSRPKGIYFPNGFTTGTTEEVTGYFSESCCNPDLKLIAYDRQNNRKTRYLNAYRANLGPGAIAAIVLGIIILLLIIIAIIVCCVKGMCKCPKCPTTESYDLPTYRGPSRY